VDRRWVVNSFPIIVISRTSLIWIVRELSNEIIVPMAVASEINEASERDPAKQWLRTEGGAYIRNIGVGPRIEWTERESVFQNRPDNGRVFSA